MFDECTAFIIKMHSHWIKGPAKQSAVLIQTLGSSYAASLVSSVTDQLFMATDGIISKITIGMHLSEYQRQILPLTKTIFRKIYEIPGLFLKMWAVNIINKKGKYIKYFFRLRQVIRLTLAKTISPKTSWPQLFIIMICDVVVCQNQLNH